MSRTRDYLTKRLGTVKANAAMTEHEIARLQKQHTAELAEVTEAEAALAAVDALTEPDPDDPDDDAIAAEIDAAFAEPEEDTPKETDD